MLHKGFSTPDGEWLLLNFFEVTGKPINTHLLYEVSRSTERENRFEDYLATRIMQDSGKNQVDLKVSRQMGILLTIENTFGTMEISLYSKKRIDSTKNLKLRLICSHKKAYGQPEIIRKTYSDIDDVIADVV